MIKVNGIEVTPTIFPDKTSQVWKLPNNLFCSSIFYIEWFFEQEAELIHLLQLRELLQKGRTHACCDLYIDYLPYARQDKFTDNENTFALYTFLGILEAKAWKSVTVLDPHNPKALPFNWKIKYPYRALMKAVEQTNAQCMLFPDWGAMTKYREVYELFELPYWYGTKERDPKTGNIIKLYIKKESNSKCPTPEDLQHKSILIVDDICDGGATFVKIAETLNAIAVPAEINFELNLFVTHGLFTKGLKPLQDAGICRIFDKTGERY